MTDSKMIVIESILFRYSPSYSDDPFVVGIVTDKTEDEIINICEKDVQEQMKDTSLRVIPTSDRSFMTPDRDIIYFLLDSRRL